jgi:arginine decarboxylase
MAIEGKELMEKTLALAAKARKKIAHIDGFSVLEAPEAATYGFFDLDRTRLTVNVSQLGITGYEADEILHRELGVTVELPLLNHLTSIVSLGNSNQDIERLIDAFTVLSARYYSSQTARSPKHQLFDLAFPPTQTALLPRDAFFAPKETVKLNSCIGRISAETICPYPPGIPVIILGEIISSEAVEYLKTISALGGVLTGCSDSSLETIEVI